MSYEELKQIMDAAALVVSCIKEMDKLEVDKLYRNRDDYISDIVDIVDDILAVRDRKTA